MQAQPITTIHELKQSLCDSTESKSFTCFQLHSNHKKLELGTQLHQLPDFSSEMQLSLVPGIFSHPFLF